MKDAPSAFITSEVASVLESMPGTGIYPIAHYIYPIITLYIYYIYIYNIYLTIILYIYTCIKTYPVLHFNMYILL